VDTDRVSHPQVRATDDGSPAMRHIRLLENRLDKALIKYNEAQSIRRTYEQVRQPSECSPPSSCHIVCAPPVVAPRADVTRGGGGGGGGGG